VADKQEVTIGLFMSAIGTSHHFAATQPFSRYWSEADIQRAALAEPDL
jgi:hypothetical protein